MIKLSCKLEKNYCSSQNEQSLELCHMCHNLEVNDDSVSDTIDNSAIHTFDGTDFTHSSGEKVILNRIELISLPKVTKLEGTDLIEVNGEKVTVKTEQNDLEKVILKNRDAQLKDPTKAARFNEGKPQWSYVHFKSLEPMVRVLEFGALKYAPKNWMKPMDTMKILESMQRHLAALFDGEEVDSETGISHMGHIQCNAMFYNYHKEKEKNDNN